RTFEGVEELPDGTKRKKYAAEPARWMPRLQEVVELEDLLKDAVEFVTEKAGAFEYRTLGEAISYFAGGVAWTWINKYKNQMELPVDPGMWQGKDLLGHKKGRPSDFEPAAPGPEETTACWVPESLDDCRERYGPSDAIRIWTLLQLYGP